MYLTSKGLWGAVSGEGNTTAIKEQQPHAAIVLNMKDSQLMHVIDAATAREAWTRLKNFHRTQDMANRLWLEEKFASFKYTTSSIKDHVVELETLVLKMRNANCGPNEEDVCATMLRSLPANYESLVQAFRMSMTTFSLADLVSKLIAESKDSIHIEDATALIASKGTGKQYNKKKKQHGDDWCLLQLRAKDHFARECPSDSNSLGPVQDHSNVAFNAAKLLASEDWVMDSGASAHMCKLRNSFSEYTAMQNGRSVLSAKSSAELKVIGFGTAILRVRTDRSWINAKLVNVFHVQDLNKNLFSLTAVTARGMTMTMDSEKCVVKRGDCMVATGRKQGKLMYLNTELSEDTLNTMITDGKLAGAPMESGNVCEVCATAKQSRKPFSSTKEELEARESPRKDTAVCSDVLGPITPISKSGHKYIATFILMKSRYLTIYPMRNKMRCNFLKEIRTTARLKIKVLRSDNGGEYWNKFMKTLCDDKLIKHEFTVPHNPEQNGIAERTNRTLVEMTR
ncbi:LOW QUALITY PROTEIN: Copia protein (GagintPol protein) [Phytophthora palmivora]|uniref:Copia protein (GagintPol protein) n=1 Tax=Phytophthora palmivora TaxID=4796 RepID=A0A2P4X152_9STRA|nr:LOW QUALITY PROTEIN: Copia protein (GagintPol protein) [Phytophthora palmivora]